ncbi:MAG: hypothetical protein MHPSP_004826, partial [Paramarteilia canceri]
RIENKLNGLIYDKTMLFNSKSSLKQALLILINRMRKNESIIISEDGPFSLISILDDLSELVVSDHFTIPDEFLKQTLDFASSFLMQNGSENPIIIHACKQIAGFVRRELIDLENCATCYINMYNEEEFDSFLEPCVILFMILV